MIKVRITVHGPDSDYESFVREHEEKLKEYFHRIRLEDNPKLPEGYSLENHYIVYKSVLELKDGNKVHIMEAEPIFGGYGRNSKKPYTQIRYLNEKLDAELKEGEWNEDNIASVFEEALLEMDLHLLTLLKLN